MKSKFSKILTILLIGIFCISLSGCGKQQKILEKQHNRQKRKI